jgi:hypothetical protein
MREKVHEFAEPVTLEMGKYSAIHGARSVNDSKGEKMQ